jgi:hypothetical protein
LLENRILFRDFLYTKDIVILLIQVVATYCVKDIPGYVMHYDNGTEQSGTVFVVRDGFTLTDIKDTQVDGPWWN